MKLNDFEGRWRIDRRITNAIGPDAVFTGEASFVLHGAEVRMQEVGEMRMEGQAPMQATRDYIWRAAATGIDVFFDDGRYFHHISDGPQPVAHHDCAPDIYDVSYDFRDWPQWRSTWRVQGPRKDYVMESRFSR